MATIEQYRRFVANEPEADIEYRTIELWHPDFDQIYRFVNNYTDLAAGLESTAPRNAGETVVFTAAGIVIEEPQERNDADQVLTINMAAVDDTLDDIIEQISGTGFLEQMQVVYRKYYSRVLTEPAVTPLYLFGSGIAFENTESATFTAEDTDLSMKRSGIIYTTELFVGLQ